MPDTQPNNPSSNDPLDSNILSGESSVAESDVAESNDETKSIGLPVLGEKPESPPVVALLGNPNAGKTTLFNSLTGLRAKTANFPGTTVDYRHGTLTIESKKFSLIDLPGAYSLEATSPDEEVTREYLLNNDADMILVVVDATNLQRNLFLVSQLIELETPVVVALNMIDSATSQGLKIDVKQLQKELDCPVVSISAKTGENISQLKTVIANQFEHGCETAVSKDVCGSCNGCQYAARYDWAESVSNSSVDRSGVTRDPSKTTLAIDKVVTHPVIGLACFSGVGLLTFMFIFWFASFPMELMDWLFGTAGEVVGGWMPEGDFQGLVTEGIIGGVGGMLIFLPQIMILFFMISLLEDSGYLARAAFVMDRLMYKVGLPGKAFVPMLSAHACAIPAIMATKVIDDKRDRLKTILILPLMTCSARLPVYSMVVAILFPSQPILAALTFAIAYSLGIIVALIIAFIFKMTILPGETKPLVIELPPYRFPSFRNAFLTSIDRAKMFIKKAGTVILLFSIGLWFLATYPKTAESDLSESQTKQLTELRSQEEAAEAEKVAAKTAANDQQEMGDQQEVGDNDDDEEEEKAPSEIYFESIKSENSFAGRIGKTVQPVFAPLGYDWKLTVGIINSFAAREVVVSTLAILYGTSEDGLTDSLKEAKRADGTKVFNTATCLSVLVFFIFAMQCLPTTAIVKRETGGWFWAIFQIVYMTVLAYGLAFLAYRIGLMF